MATPEGKVKTWLRGQLRKKYPSAKLTFPRGGPYGKAGTFDIIMCVNGLYVEIEVKAPNGQLTDLQIKNGNDVIKAGGIAAMIRDKDFDKLEILYNEIDRRHCYLKRAFDDV